MLQASLMLCALQALSTAAVNPPDRRRAACSLHMPGMLQANRNAMLQTRPVLSALQNTLQDSRHFSALQWARGGSAASAPSKV